MIKKLELLPDSEIVYAKWVGPIDAEKRHHLRKEIMNKCIEHSSSKFIVDLREQIHVVDAKESYEFGRTFRREMQGFKLAVIINNLTKSEFIISETINRGDVEMKTFNDFEKAYEWISNQ